MIRRETDMLFSFSKWDRKDHDSNPDGIERITTVILLQSLKITEIVVLENRGLFDFLKSNSTSTRPKIDS